MISDEQLHAMAQTLMTVPGVRAIALGGSRARGTHHDGSDVDLGLYYDREALDVAGLRDATSRFSTAGTVDVAGPGSWGTWVDGGAWLSVEGTAVDWILRDVRRVRGQCERAQRGEFAFHPQPGHPLGFLDVSYAGEVATCVPLADPSGILSALRGLVAPYPAALRTAMVGNLWQAGFHAVAAVKGIAKRDSAYVMLCCTSALMLCAHAWHAAAGRWSTNEKGLVVDVAALDIPTHDFARRATEALTCPSSSRGDLAAVAERTRSLVDLTRRTLDPQ